MPEFIHSKARLGQAPGIVVSPRSGKGNHPRKVAESQQGNGAVAGHEEVVSSSTTYAAINGTRFGVFKFKDRRCLNMSLSIDLSQHKKIIT